MFKDFPNLHPLVVHFPIVLILVSAALQAVLVFKDWPPVRWITLVVMAGGFAGALAASTVFHAMPMGLSPQVAEVFSAHEQYASYALWLSGITLLLGGVGEFFQLRRRAFDVLVLVAALAAAGAVSVAGHHGAQLVYIAGVGPQGHLVMKGDHEHGAGAMPGMTMGDAHGDDHAEGDHHEEATQAGDHDGDSHAAASPPHASKMADMPGMGSSNKTAGPAEANAPMPGMSGMDMAAPKKGSHQPQAPAKSDMADMPGMKMPGSKKKLPMPKGMEMSGSSKLPAMGAMSGMKGMDMKPAGKKKPSKAAPEMSDMGNMPNMPGMAMPSGQKPKPNAPPMHDMKNMPGMEKGQAMPGMSMPNPMDKYRFEDNNPAREQPKKDH